MISILSNLSFKFIRIILLQHSPVALGYPALINSNRPASNSSEEFEIGHFKSELKRIICKFALKNIWQKHKMYKINKYFNIIFDF